MEKSNRDFIMDRFTRKEERQRPICLGKYDHSVQSCLMCAKRSDCSKMAPVKEADDSE